MGSFSGPVFFFPGFRFRVQGLGFEGFGGFGVRALARSLFCNSMAYTQG